MFDVFISYASEDREAVAAPLAEGLAARGLEVWFDRASIRRGDDARAEIDPGIAASAFGVVVLSPRFIEKRWTQRELSGLTAREMSGTLTVLPVVYELTRDDVEAFSPPLAGKDCLFVTDGLDEVVAQIATAVRPDLDLSDEERRARGLRARLERAFDERRYEDALAIADEWAALQPDTATPRWFRSVARRSVGDFDGAAEDAEAAVRLAPLSPSALVTRGQAHAAVGRAAESRADWESALLLPPRDADDLVALATAANALGRYDEALDLADRALVRTPRQLPARAARAVALSGAGRYSEAHDEITVILEAGVPTADLLLTLAQLRAVQGNAGGALEAADQALQLEHQHVGALVSRAMYLPPDRTGEAIRAATDALAIAPGHPFALVTRAVAFYRDGRKDDARRDVEAVASSQAETPAETVVRAQALAMLERNAEAVEEASRAIKLAPQDPHPLGIRSQAYFSMGRFDEAFRDISTALERMPANPAFLVLRAQCHIVRGDDAAATRDAAEVLRVSPNDPQAQRMMSMAQSPLKRTAGRLVAKWMALQGTRPADDNRQRDGSSEG